MQQGKHVCCRGSHKWFCRLGSTSARGVWPHQDTVTANCQTAHVGMHMTRLTCAAAVRLYTPLAGGIASGGAYRRRTSCSQGSASAAARSLLTSRVTAASRLFPPAIGLHMACCANIEHPFAIYVGCHLGG
jgi:hypothetical protein